MDAQNMTKTEALSHFAEMANRFADVVDSGEDLVDVIQEILNKTEKRDRSGMATDREIEIATELAEAMTVYYERIEFLSIMRNGMQGEAEIQGGEIDEGMAGSGS